MIKKNITIGRYRVVPYGDKGFTYQVEKYYSKGDEWRPFAYVASQARGVQVVLWNLLQQRGPQIEIKVTKDEFALLDTFEDRLKELAEEILEKYGKAQ